MKLQFFKEYFLIDSKVEARFEGLSLAAWLLSGLVCYLQEVLEHQRVPEVQVHLFVLGSHLNQGTLQVQLHPKESNSNMSTFLSTSNNLVDHSVLLKLISLKL